MATPAYGTPGSVGYVDPFAPSPTVPAVVPTKAPPLAPGTGTATNTTVVNSQPATNAVNNIKSTLDTTQQETLAQNQARAANAGKPGYDVFGNPVVGSQTGAPQTGTVKQEQTPEEKIASQPSDGMTFIYDANGTQHQIGINDPVPAGYSKTNPRAEPTTPVTATAQTNLNLYKQYSDGSYGRFSLDQNGNYAYAGTATAQDFAGALAQQTGTQALQTILNGGSLPLNSDQQAQVSGLAAQFQEEIRKQAIVNANVTGAEGIFQMLHGGAGQIDTVTAIADTVTKGAALIADLNTKMTTAIAQMKSGFQTDNYNMLKSAYDTYTTNEAAKNKAITDMQDKAAQVIKDAQAEKDKQAQMLATQNDATDASIRTAISDVQKNGGSPAVIAAMNDALKKHDFAAAVTAAGDSLRTMTGDFADYPQYVRDTTAAGLVPLDGTKWLAQKTAADAKQKVNEAYATAYAAEKGRGAAADAGGGYAGTTQKEQQQMETQFRNAIRTTEDSSRGGTFAINNIKISTANQLAALTAQYYDPKTGNYNISKQNYGELVIGLAGLLSTTGNPTETQLNDINTATAAGDLGKAYTYATGQVANGSSQDVLKQIVQTIDRVAQQAVANREALHQEIVQTQMPTQLDPARADKILSGELMPYVGIPSLAKDAIDGFIKTNGTNPLPKPVTTSDGKTLTNMGEMVAYMLDQPGATDANVQDYLKAKGYMQ